MLTAIRTPSSTTLSVRYSRAVSPAGGIVQMPSLTSRIPSAFVRSLAFWRWERTSAACAAIPYPLNGCGLVVISALCSPSSFSKSIKSNSRRGTRIRVQSVASSSAHRPSAAA